MKNIICGCDNSSYIKIGDSEMDILEINAVDSTNSYKTVFYDIIECINCKKQVYVKRLDY